MHYPMLSSGESGNGREESGIAQTIVPLLPWSSEPFCAVIHIWNNLLSNAFKFTGNGGTVGVRLSSDETYAVVNEKRCSPCGPHRFSAERCFCAGKAV